MTIARGGPPPLDLLRGASLFLDFDGTLVELAARPDSIVVDGRVRAVIGVLGDALDGRVAIVSGRSVAQIRGFLGEGPLAVSGSHGVELHWADGRRRDVAAPEWLPAMIERMEAFGQSQPGVVVEVKPFGVALHYREAPDAEDACHLFAESMASGETHIQKGKMMVELRVAGDKGDAVRTFMGDPALTGTSPFFFGDDLTDEPAFAVAAELGGAGVLVGEHRDSAACYRLDGVPETLDWLEAAAAALR
jgi:trehalose 6-phosphate phosphatase